MELYQVRYFLALCDTLNFTRAAEDCHVAQPSLTRAIKALEEELGGLLFHRERNNTHLTELGRLIKPHLETAYGAVLAAGSEAEDYRSQAQASLRLGVMSTLSPMRLVDFITTVRTRLPALDLTFHDGPAVKLVESLVAGEIDLGLIGMPTYPERCDARPLYAERYVVAFPAGHRFEAMNGVPMEHLTGESYLQRIHCEFRYHFEALGVERKHFPVLRYSSEREDWIQALILAGQGCSVMPESLPLLPGLRRRVIIDPEVSRTIHLVTIAGRRFAPAVQAFVRLAHSYNWLAA